MSKHPPFDGTQPGPGRPRGSSGRTAALAILDSVLREEKTQDAMRTALRAYILRNPVRAFRVLIMPLLPRTHIADFGQENITWRSFLAPM